MTEVDPDRRQLAALHKHWVVADSVNHHLRRSVKAGADDRSGLPDAAAQFAQHASVLATITVWYALLYVVVEGYCKLGCRNPEIDRLLAEGSYVDALRRFRNATFHFQVEPLTPKLMMFLMTPDSEKWIHALNAAFRRFFEEQLNLKEMLARFGVQADVRGVAGDD